MFNCISKGVIIMQTSNFHKLHNARSIYILKIVLPVSVYMYLIMLHAYNVRHVYRFTCTIYYYKYRDLRVSPSGGKSLRLKQRKRSTRILTSDLSRATPGNLMGVARQRGQHTAGAVVILE